MKRVLTSLIAALLLVSLTACEGEKSKTCGTAASQPAGGDTQLSLMKEMLVVMKTIKDKDSALAAKPKLDAIEKRMGVVANEMQTVNDEMREEVGRMRKDPEIAEALGIPQGPPMGAPGMPGAGAPQPKPGTMEDYEAMRELQIDMMKKRLAVVKGVKDVASAKAAQKKMGAMMQEYLPKIMQMSGIAPPSPEMQKKLDAKYGKQMDDLGAEMDKERERIEKLPPEVFDALTGKTPAAPAPGPPANPAPMP